MVSSSFAAISLNYRITINTSYNEASLTVLDFLNGVSHSMADTRG